jgi:hypothetical protein
VRRTEQDEGRRRGRRRLLLLSVGVAACIVLAYVAYSAFAGSSGRSAAAQAALRYARTEMVWIQGPSIAYERTATMGALPALLRTVASTSLRKDVNTADLIRRYGPHRRIDIIVLSGVYNSLPPDEGVNVQGEVLVLVDPRTDRVLFLTA